jgi:hypothetical protein
VKLQVRPLQVKLKREVGGAFVSDPLTVTSFETLPLAP